MEHAEARCDCATGHGDFPWLAAGLFHGLWEYTRYADLNGRVSAYTTPTGLRSLSFDAAGRITSATDDSSAIRFQTTHARGGNAYTYHRIHYGPYTITSGDNLEYDYLVDPTSVTGWGVGAFEIDLTTSPWSGRNVGLVDQHAHAINNSMPSFTGIWLSRRISLAPLVGKTISSFNLVVESDIIGSYSVRYRNVRITDGASATRLNVWRSGALDSNVTAYSNLASAISAALQGNTRTQSFEYDDTERLTRFGGFTSAGSEESRFYTYDLNGNRRTSTVNGVPATYTYSGTSNRLLAVSGLYSNTYDAAGNLLSDGRLAHAYDTRGRLVQTTVPNPGGTTLTNYYNYLGLRVGQWDSAANSGKMWLYDEDGRMLGEYTYPSVAPVHEFSWLGSTMVGVAGNLPELCGGVPCVTYGVGRVWTDHLGTPRAITRGSGTRIWEWESAAFGDTAPSQNPQGAGLTVFNHRFPGQHLDAKSGFHQNWTIRRRDRRPGSQPGTTQYHDPVNNITVVVSNTTGNVVTVWPGPASLGCIP